MIGRRGFLASLAAWVAAACVEWPQERTVVAGRFGVVLNGFADGNSSLADHISLAVLNPTAFTIAGFFQQFTAEGLAAFFAQMPLGVHGDCRFALTTSNSGTGVAIWSSDSAGTSTTSIYGITADGTWSTGARTHVAAAYDGSLSAANRWKVYVGGTQVSFSTTNGTFPASLDTSTYPILAGRCEDGFQTMNGIVDTVTLHSSALSDANIALLAAGTHVSTTWVDTWPCDDEAGDYVHSATGDNRATLVPAPSSGGPRFVTRTFAGASTGSGNPIRVMPLGDSELYTTSAEGFIRAEVYSRLVYDGFYVNFVGSQTGGNPGFSGFDGDHEAVPGKRIGASSAVASTIRGDLAARIGTYLADSGGMRVAWLRAGKNDIWADGTTGAQTAQRLYDCVTEGASYSPGIVWIIQAPAHWTNGSFSSQLADYVALMPGVVDDLVAAGVNAVLVDTYSVSTTRDLGDGTHESRVGCLKSATQVYQAMRAGVLAAHGHAGTALLGRGGSARCEYRPGGAAATAYKRGGAARVVL